MLKARISGWISTAALFAAAPIHAQEVAIVEDRLSIQFDEADGTPLEEFIKLAELQTGLQLTYNSGDTRDVRLRFLGAKEVPRAEFWSYFQSVLKAYDFVVVPYGGDASFFAIRRSSGNAVGGSKPGYIKSQAKIVDSDQLDAYRDQTGLVLTTSFALEHVNVQEATNMLQTYFTDPMLESVRAVTNSNSLVATGFAPTLCGIKGLLTQIDVPMKRHLAVDTETIENTRIYHVKHVDPNELARVLGTWSAQTGLQTNSIGGGVVFVPAAGSRALLITSSKSNYDAMLPMIEELDRKPE